MTAEQQFRNAFERLKTDSTVVLPKGSRVTQNNVAREAGCDPSALKKSRYPSLISEIQNWAQLMTSTDNVSKTHMAKKARFRNRDLREEISRLQAERDLAFSLLAEADAKILDLNIQNTRLESHRRLTNVTPLKAKG